jgi:prepilin-type N-terminal cleavage/methylation domain-containing protein
MPDSSGRHSRPGFTLIEVLIVLAMLALLASLLVPSILTVRKMARISTAHADLRTLTVAMVMYRKDNDSHLPPTRLSCASRTAYELPEELIGYVPGREENGIRKVDMPDPFSQDETYLYRAPGPGLLNEYTLVEDAGTIWIPDEMDSSDPGPGRYYRDPRKSPVRYAFWSAGPDPADEKLQQPGRLPIPRWSWLQGVGDVGVITHFEGKHGNITQSP